MVTGSHRSPKGGIQDPFRYWDSISYAEMSIEALKLFICLLLFILAC